MEQSTPRPETVDIRSTSIASDLERARESGGFIRFVGHGSYTDPDLSCIRDAAWVRSVTLYDLVNCDLSALSTLPNLFDFYAQGEFDRSLKIDLSRSFSLRSFTGPWTSAVRLPDEDVGLEGVSLNKGGSDLRTLPAWKTLRSLWIFRTKITSFDGLERFPALEEVRLDSAPFLTDIGALKAVSKLRKCELIGCSRLQSLAGLESCTHLNDVLIASCRQVSDISLLASLPELETLRLLHVPDLARQALAWKSNIAIRAYPTPRALKGRSRSTPPAEAHSSDSPAIAALRRCLPTLAWNERMEDGDETFTRRGIRAAERLLNGFLDRVGSVPHGSAELSDAFREIVQAFNKLNIDHSGLLETIEREELVDFLSSVADTVGFEHEGNDVTAQWRMDW